MTQSQGGSGATHAPGSPEDLQLTMEVLQQFFAEKLKASRMFKSQGATTASTANTRSVCHIDGTTDGD